MFPTLQTGFKNGTSVKIQYLLNLGLLTGQLAERHVLHRPLTLETGFEGSEETGVAGSVSPYEVGSTSFSHGMVSDPRILIV